jgi:hypothetical protein
MSSPTSDPRIVLILSKMAQAFIDNLYPDNGFYTSLDNAYPEPVALNPPEVQVRAEHAVVMLEEEFDEINGANSTMFQATAVVAAHGYIRTSTAASPYTIAFRFREDITRMLRSIGAATLKDDAGKPLIRSIALTGRREIVPSDLAEGYLEVVVRVAVDYRDSSSPVPGI